MRPPWAAAEDAFLTGCDRCGDCISSCPERVIRLGDGGFPEVDFATGGCSFCGECAAACRGKALTGDPEHDRPWGLVAEISGNCLAHGGVVCRSCGEVCDERAIRFRLRVGGAAEPLLHADRCTGCGMCFGVCPVRAVKLTATGQRNPATAG
ncbi:MAG: ferredoxin-type protein NapF [Pseudomonadota bacterium]|nr:ferredoxin-type protein NapF [Pseudomonadota bacterium]